MRILLHLCSLLCFFYTFQAISLENAEEDNYQNEENASDNEQQEYPQNNFQQQGYPQNNFQQQFQQTPMANLNQTQNDFTDISQPSDGEQQTIENSETTVNLNKKEERQIESHVKEILEKSLIENVSSEDKSEEKILEHTQNLERNIEALRGELHEYSEAKKSENSKVKKLHSLINSAFTDYFGGEAPSDEKLKEATNKNNKKSDIKKSTKAKNSTGKKRTKSHINKAKVYTVKQGIFTTKNYNSSLNEYRVKSWAGYESKKNSANNSTHYRIKTFGSENNAEQKFTVKQPYFKPNTSKCCGS